MGDIPSHTIRMGQKLSHTINMGDIHFPIPLHCWRTLRVIILAFSIGSTLVIVSCSVHSTDNAWLSLSLSLTLPPQHWSYLETLSLSLSHLFFPVDKNLNCVRDSLCKSIHVVITFSSFIYCFFLVDVVYYRPCSLTRIQCPSVPVSHDRTTVFLCTRDTGGLQSL